MWGLGIDGLLQACPVDACPTGSCVHAVSLMACRRDVLSRGTHAPPPPPPWATHIFPSHALQRRQPALLASAGLRLQPTAPVSGCITASSAAQDAAWAMDLCFRAGSQMLGPALRVCRSAPNPVLN